MASDQSIPAATRSASARVLAALFVVAVFVPSALAGDLITERASFEDSTVRTKWPEAQGQPHETCEGSLIVIPGGARERTDWLRLKTESPNLMHAAPLPLLEAVERDRVQELVLSVLPGAILLLAAWAILIWLASLGPLMPAFAVQQVVALLFAACNLGCLRFALAGYVPVGCLDQTYHQLAFLHTGASPWFYGQFLQDCRPPREWMLVHPACLSVLPVSSASAALGHVTPAARLNLIGLSGASAMLPMLAGLNCPACASAPGGAVLFSSRS